MTNEQARGLRKGDRVTIQHPWFSVPDAGFVELIYGESLMARVQEKDMVYDVPVAEIERVESGVDGG